MKNQMNGLSFTSICALFAFSMGSSSAYTELIEGFPEGCAYANMNEPLPYQFLGYGRIRWMGSSFAFQYMDQNAPGPFAIAAIADNVGLIGQNPEQNISVDLMARTPRENYVVAQILDRSEMGLDPIVTCISPIFYGTINAGQPIVFGNDYWTEYRRYRDYKWSDIRRVRWDRWKNRWKDRVRDWRKNWRDKGGDRDRIPGRVKRPVLRPKPVRENQRPTPGLIKPIKEREDIVTTRPVPGRGERRPRVNLELPQGLENRRGRINIQVPDDKRGQEGRIRINIPDDNKAQREERRRPRLNLELPQGLENQRRIVNTQDRDDKRGRQGRIRIDIPDEEKNSQRRPEEDQELKRPMKRQRRS